jgi:hypothetical protein
MISTATDNRRIFLALSEAARPVLVITPLRSNVQPINKGPPA